MLETDDKYCSTTIAILGLFRERGDSQYGREAVSQQEHALQAAFFAEAAGASSSLMTHPNEGSTISMKSLPPNGFSADSGRKLSSQSGYTLQPNDSYAQPNRITWSSLAQRQSSVCDCKEA